MKRVQIPCDNVVNATTIHDGDPVAILEFRKRMYEKNMNVNDKLILNFESKKGLCIVQEYSIHAIWIKGMETFSFMELSPEAQQDRNLRKRHEERGGKSGIVERVPVRPTRRFFDKALH